MNFCIEAAELRAALKEIEQAEQNGFGHSLAVFRLRSVGPMLSDHLAEYSDLWDRAHPTDGKLDWGRQRASRWNRVENGELVPLVCPEPEEQT